MLPVEIILDSQIMKVQVAHDLLKMILSKAAKSRSNNHILMYLRKNSYLWKLFEYFPQSIPTNVKIRAFASEVGCLQPWVALKKAISNFKENNISDLPSIVIVDQDVESFSTGIVTFEPNGSLVI